MTVAKESIGQLEILDCIPDGTHNNPQGSFKKTVAFLFHLNQNIRIQLCMDMSLFSCVFLSLTACSVLPSLLDSSMLKQPLIIHVSNVSLG